MTGDPRIEALARAVAVRPPRAGPREDRVEAAVALLLRPAEDLEALLVLRAEREADPWSGHVALPGGRRQAGDPDLSATAARETLEEVGIDPRADGRLLGRLDDVSPATPRLPPIVVVPWLFAVPAGTVARPDGREVVGALWTPLARLRDAEAATEVRIDAAGERRFPAIRVGEEAVLWGLTRRIVTGFLEIAGAAGV